MKHLLPFLILMFMAACTDFALREPVRSIRIVAEGGGREGAQKKLDGLLQKYPDFEGAILKDIIYCQRFSPDEGTFLAQDFVGEFKKLFGASSYQAVGADLINLKNLLLELQITENQAKFLERFEEENEVMVRLPFNMWLRPFWDPRMSPDPQKRDEILERRKWVVREVDKLPVSLKSYQQNFYKEPMAIRRSIQIPHPLKALFPPPCKNPAEQKSCIANWNIQVGKFLDQLSISQAHTDPETGSAIPEREEFVYWGTFYIKTRRPSEIIGSPNFTSPRGIAALINYLEKNGLEVKVFTSWVDYIPK